MATAQRKIPKRCRWLKYSASYGPAVSADTRRRVRDILESDREMEDLTNQIIMVSARNDPEHVRRCELLVSKLRPGLYAGALGGDSARLTRPLG
jgi:hypothetical protein